MNEFTIITGRGKHSRQPFEPVLRPVAQDMLLEEFQPPIPTHFDPTNDGRLQVRELGTNTKANRELIRDVPFRFLRGCRNIGRILSPSTTLACDTAWLYSLEVVVVRLPPVLGRRAFFQRRPSFLDFCRGSARSCTPTSQVRKEDILAWCLEESVRGQRAPAPADNVGSLKLRGVLDLKMAYDEAVSQVAASAAAAGSTEAGSGSAGETTWSGVGWSRNSNEILDG